ncbi:hypothetical protein ACFCYX_33070 [Streptomyces populi]|uniref:hypothetical protein n=1 Tax=Streptomyces populi TaxID=2058924 RepID=UPI0013A6C958|nr:hypothetical protein [Streptomyces populi]
MPAVLPAPERRTRAATGTARALGHRHALDPSQLAAQAAGTLVEQGCLAEDWQAWPGPSRRLADRCVARRRRRWAYAAAAHHDAREHAARALALGRRTDPAERHRLHRAMTRTASEQPARPGWNGDRIHTAAVRLERDHHLDLGAVWPALWFVLPDPVRAEITEARQTLSRATTFAAWSAFYPPLTYWWWPVAPIAASLAAIGRIRIRSAADGYALRVEAAARLHAGDLARSPGTEHSGPLTTETGDAVTRLLGGGYIAATPLSGSTWVRPTGRRSRSEPGRW